MVHYAPFWRKLPQEALEVVHWAVENDREAQHIGQQGQLLAQRYFNKRALSCFWLMLLHEYRKLFKFTPAHPDRQYPKKLVPLSEWLQKMKVAERAGGVWIEEQEVELEDPPGTDLL